MVLQKPSCSITVTDLVAGLSGVVSAGAQKYQAPRKSHSIAAGCLSQVTK